MTDPTPAALVVYCHPNPASFTAAVRTRVVEGLRRGGVTVEVLDLYAERFDPALVVDEQRRRRDLDRVEETRRHREQLTASRALIFVYPVWWGTFPAMLKGYVDRVFVSGRAYTFEGRPPGAVFPEGLLRGKEAHFFYTLDAPWWVALFDFGWFSNLFSVFRYCGLRTVRRHYLSGLKHTTAERRAAWLTEVESRAEAIGRRLRG